MAQLLCVTPWPGSPRSYGRIPHALLPRWRQAFDRIGVWCTSGSPAQHPYDAVDAETFHTPAPLEERLPELVAMVNSGEWSHVWIIGDLAFLTHLASLGIIHDRVPNVRLYAYAVIESPFVPDQYANVAQYFDFFVGMSGMALGAYKQAVADSIDIDDDKTLLKVNLHTKIILPGVDSTVFHPQDVQSGDYGREEIRQATFGRKLDTKDLLLMVSGSKTRQKGIPAACAITRALQDLLDRRVRIYFHMPGQASGPNPIHIPMLAAGCDLDPTNDVLYGDRFFDEDEHPKLRDHDLNLLYNAADVVLCPDLIGGWCFTATEAMAAGRVVAAPDEHVWVDVVAGRGIELPSTQFTWAPWNTNEYARAVDPSASARAIAEVVSDVDKSERAREAGVHWATQDPTASWDYCAQQWLQLFGFM